MIVAIAAAVLACLAFATAGPRMAALLPPAAAVRLLVPTAVVSAGTGVFVLATVTFTGLGQLSELTNFVAWSPRRLHALTPIPPVASVVAGALLLPIAVWTARATGRSVRALWLAHRTCRHLDNYRRFDDRHDVPVVVVENPEPDAYTLTGFSARVVVTTGLLAALEPEGQRILLAHEHSHRRHRHTWWTLAADLAAAVNPLLRPTARAIRHATERWADEDAAATTDRRRVAATIAHVALLRTRPGPPVPSPAQAAAAATGGQVPRRVEALLRPAPTMRAHHLTALAALILAVLLGAAAVEHTGETLFERAEQPAASQHLAAVAHR